MDRKQYPIFHSEQLDLPIVVHFVWCNYDEIHVLYMLCLKIHVTTFSMIT